MKCFLEVSTLSILVFSAAASVHAQPNVGPTPSPTPAKIEHSTKFDGNLEFPQISGWTLAPKYIYPTADLGYSVNYESPEGGRVIVYVYNSGQTTIPNALTGVVVDEMNRAKADIQAAVNSGTYESAKVLRSATVNFGGTSDGLKAIFASYELSISGNQLHSEIYVFPYQNYFVKIRATRPKAYATSGVVVDLLAKLGVLFSR